MAKPAHITPARPFEETEAPFVSSANDNDRQSDPWRHVITMLSARWPNLGVRAWQARLAGWGALEWCETLVAGYEAQGIA